MEWQSQRIVRLNDLPGCPMTGIHIGGQAGSLGQIAPVDT
jgi:hypothetical protein